MVLFGSFVLFVNQIDWWDVKEHIPFWNIFCIGLNTTSERWTKTFFDEIVESHSYASYASILLKYVFIHITPKRKGRFICEKFVGKMRMNAFFFVLLINLDLFWILAIEFSSEFCLDWWSNCESIRIEEQSSRIECRTVFDMQHSNLTLF